jgi:hypothetical protein
VAQPPLLLQPPKALTTRFGARAAAARVLFRVADADGDGVVTHSEARAALTTVPELGSLLELDAIVNANTGGARLGFVDSSADAASSGGGEGGGRDGGAASVSFATPPSASVTVLLWTALGLTATQGITRAGLEQRLARAHRALDERAAASVSAATCERLAAEMHGREVRVIKSECHHESSNEHFASEVSKIETARVLVCTRYMRRRTACSFNHRVVRQ